MVAYMDIQFLEIWICEIHLHLHKFYDEKKLCSIPDNDYLQLFHNRN